MKNIILTAVFFISAVLTANAQSVKVGGGLTVSYNEAAAKNIGFSLDVADNAGYLATCKDASAAIHYIVKEQSKNLTPNEKLAIYAISKEQPPQWLLKNAGAKQL